MFRHHPALVGLGAALSEDGRELHIAQRQALHAAVEACRTGDPHTGPEPLVAAAIAAYLETMRREFRPEAIKIGEGDFVRLDVAGARLEVHAEVLRERDVQRGEYGGREWPKATIRGEGYFVDDAEGEQHPVDGLTLYLGDF